MGYKTLDGHELNEGDECFVAIQDPAGERNFHSNPRKAVYLDDAAKANGWEFTIAHLRSDDPVEVTAVWKTNPYYVGPKEWD